MPPTTPLRHPPRTAVLAVLSVLALVWACTRPNPRYLGGGAGGDPGDLDTGPGQPGDTGTVPDTGGSGEWDVGPAPAGRVVGFEVGVPRQVREDAPFEVIVVPVDDRGEPAGGYSGTVRIRSDRGDVSLPGQPPAPDGAVQIPVSRLPAAGVTVRLVLNREGEATLTVTDDRGREGRSEPFRVVHGRWVLVRDEPVFSPGRPGTWDDGYVGHPCVIEDGDVFRMYYAGRRDRNASALNQTSVGMAVSPDGIHWQRAREGPVLAASGDRNSWVLYSEPAVLRGNARSFQMWYAMVRNGQSAAVGYAFSPDGLAFDAVSDGPVLAPEPTVEWEEQRVFSPAVLRHEGVFHLWFGTSEAGGGKGIGHATSRTGVEWTRTDLGPVLRPAPEGWDAGGVESPTVIRDGSVFRMWYSASGTRGGGPEEGTAIGYATSTDGVTWEKSPDNPVLRPSRQPGRFDSSMVKEPSVLVVDGELYLYFSAFDGRTVQIGLARREDL